MDFTILLSNFTSPALLFFLLGIIAVVVKSDLEIPPAIGKFLSIYLLFSIGFRGGRELTHGAITPEITRTLLFGLGISIVIALVTFYILKRKFSIHNACAVSASYGSVNPVTFFVSLAFLEAQKVHYGGHMVAVMALMESPSIIIAMLLLNKYDPESRSNSSIGHTLKHAFTNGSVLIILGSFIVGMIADKPQAEAIKPFTTDIFKGLLIIFMLDMGMLAAKKFATFRQYGLFATSFALLVPVICGSSVAVLSGFVMDGIGERFVIATCAASASYIAVPAAMRLTVPKADPGLYVSMALGVTFPFNITLGMPLYYLIVQHC